MQGYILQLNYEVNMIENFILSVIKFLNHIVIELKRAYCETYGDKELMKQFNAEVERRKKINKRN
jgi:hypothetical protein|nr:MAG TPA: hypothetical protein [Caudoviricetes sp.]